MIFYFQYYLIQSWNAIYLYPNSHPRQEYYILHLCVHVHQ